jgi:hypothetical protein
LDVAVSTALVLLLSLQARANIAVNNNPDNNFIIQMLLGVSFTIAHPFLSHS